VYENCKEKKSGGVDQPPSILNIQHQFIIIVRGSIDHPLHCVPILQDELIPHVHQTSPAQNLMQRSVDTPEHICASNHSNFFLTFVECIASISHKYVFMPCTLEELEPIMQRYEEGGLPGVAGSVDVV